MTAPLDRIDHLFAHNARTLPDSAHLTLPDGTTQTYGQTFERARRVAQALVAAGVRRGDRVLLFMGNSRELEELYVATSLAGAICVPVNTLTTARELVGTTADCGPRALVVQHQFLDRVTPEVAGAEVALRLVTHGEAPGWASYDATLAAAAPLDVQVSADPDDPCVMIYSSGTTGRPKGILLRQRAAIDNALMVVRVMRYQMSDVFLTMLPLFSSFGFAWDFLMPAHAGARTVLLARFDPAEAAAKIERHRVSVLAGVPTMFARLFDADNVKGRDLSSLRLMDVGGGPVADRLKHDLKHLHGIEIVESYGLSEISPTASVQIPFGRHRPGSCGPALPGIEVKVVDAAGAEVAPGMPGELCFRGPTFMIGYWNKPELTAQTLREGWLHSGDIGTIDEDGHIYIRDRLKDLIITSGYNVYPKEVENALCEHPAVQTCAAVGLPDEIRGENIHAFVVLKSGAAATEAELIGHCGRLIAKYKVPRGVTFVEELPLTASGKIQRFQLRERAQRAQGRAA
jgi:long-chain acyl-CoA synthetase